MNRKTFLTSVAVSLGALVSFLSFRNIFLGKRQKVSDGYIDLRDKSGKEICDGDIIIHDLFSDSRRWNESVPTNFQITSVSTNNGIVYCFQLYGESPIHNKWKSEDIKIIGNIHTHVGEICPAIKYE